MEGSRCTWAGHEQHLQKSTSSENQRSTQEIDDVKDCMFPYPSNIPIVLLLFGQCLEKLHMWGILPRSLGRPWTNSGVQPTGAAGDEKQFENLWVAAVAS